MDASSTTKFATAQVASGVILDSRLCLFHEGDRWLAVSDLHLGYEVNRRSGGGLFPLWGQKATADRLREVVLDYRPDTLILAGDIVDGGGAAADAIRLIDELRSHCGDVVCLRGNHERGAFSRAVDLRDWLVVGDYFFHHGHQQPNEEVGARVEIIGHHHPSVFLGDGAGMRLRLPALVQEPQRWVLPAFSPWAGGGRWKGGEDGANSNCRQWLCHEARVFLYDAPDEDAEKNRQKTRRSRLGAASSSLRGARRD